MARYEDDDIQYWKDGDSEGTEGTVTTGMYSDEMK
jgi:hypothetical protein